jgi:hypothetical protein
MEASCQDTELAVVDSRQGVVLQLRGLGEVLTATHSKKSSFLRKIPQGLGFFGTT